MAINLIYMITFVFQIEIFLKHDTTLHTNSFWLVVANDTTVHATSCLIKAYGKDRH